MLKIYRYLLTVGILFACVIKAKFETNFQVFERCQGNTKLNVLSPLKSLNGVSNMIKCAAECTHKQNCTAVNFCKDDAETTCELVQDTVDMTTCLGLTQQDSCTFLQMVNAHSEKTGGTETATLQITTPLQTASTSANTSSLPTVIGKIYTEQEMVGGSYPTCSSPQFYVGTGCLDMARDCTEVYNHGYRTDTKVFIQPKLYNYFFVQCNLQDTKRGVTKLFVHGEPCGVEEWFYRDYNMYSYEFGAYDCDHWKGLNYINLITVQGDYTLRIDLRCEDTSGNIQNDTVYYDNFYITDQTDGYKFYYKSFLGSTHGLLGDGFGEWINGTEFKASKEPDGTCPEDKSGWWYDPYCNNTNLMLPMGSVEQGFHPGARRPYWPDASGKLLEVKAVTMGVINEKYT